MLKCWRCCQEMGSLAFFCSQCGAKLPHSPKLSEPEGVIEYIKEGGEYLNECWEMFGGICSKTHHLFKKELGARFCSLCGAVLKPVTFSKN